MTIKSDTYACDKPWFITINIWVCLSGEAEKGAPSAIILMASFDLYTVIMKVTHRSEDRGVNY